MPVLPAAIAGPVDLALTQAQDDVPGPATLRGGCVYEPKWDGFRVAVVRGTSRTRLWSRNGTDLTASFPELVAAAEATLPVGCVVDGEVVAWDADRLSFPVLVRRLGLSAQRARREAVAKPASFVAFDVLAVGFGDVRQMPWQQRRALLEGLGPWAPPLQVCPVTSDREVALRWFDDFAAVGMEGLVVKGAQSPYESGRRRWIKVRRRHTTEVVLGGVVGSLRRPQAVVGGRFDGDELVMVGQSVTLSAAQAAELASVLRPARVGHPWPAEVSVGRFGSSERVRLTRVRPVVAEVAVDASVDNGRFRHPFRFLRLRPDLTVNDVPTLRQT